MEIDKVELRKQIQLLIETSNNTNDTLCMLKASIAYGMYKASGGDKIFVISPVYQNIVTVVSEVYKIRLKARQPNTNISKVFREITKISIIEDIIAIEEQGIFNISIRFTNSEDIEISIKREQLSHIYKIIAYNLIIGYDKNLLKYGHIKQYLYTYLDMIN